jgi:hypothetical protein
MYTAGSANAHNSIVVRRNSYCVYQYHTLLAHITTTATQPELAAAAAVAQQG